MKNPLIPNSNEAISAIQNEIHKSKESRFCHRLHCVLLVAKGMSCHQVSRLLGDAPGTVAYWVRRFKDHDFATLTERERSGRPASLTEHQFKIVEQTLRRSPALVGMDGHWNGKALSRFVHERFGVDLRERQCQRLFRKAEIRVPNPQPKVKKAKKRQKSASTANRSKKR